MAKQIASATAAADLATASEVTGNTAVFETIDTLPPGQSAAITDGGPVQGEATPATAPRETVEFPYFNKEGVQIGVNLIVRY